jgi:hypothetical protein
LKELKMKLKFIGSGLNSKGFQFRNGGTYEVPDEVASYLIRTFPKWFEVIDASPSTIVEEGEAKPRRGRGRKRKSE